MPDGNGRTPAHVAAAAGQVWAMDVWETLDIDEHFTLSDRTFTVECSTVQYFIY